MGFSYANRQEQLKHEAAMRASRAEADAKFERVASKIAMITIDHVNRVVVRPGPAAEERECYEMAQEIRDTDEALTNLIMDILKIAKKEGEL